MKNTSPAALRPWNHSQVALFKEGTPIDTRLPQKKSGILPLKMYCQKLWVFFVDHQNSPNVQNKHSDEVALRVTLHDLFSQELRGPEKT